ncbi:phosphatidylinositol N-acetylglucosaminyltransferase-domain-containing protein [Podospora appendiculata]|uniref:Phosphatidylinositol N-acetylglucosaminyltransferase-domain-containing protein n=1 Tax=Podospora appendiculata TaxID=314037 RepID=A0AAE0XIU4_9PEZI|nr:phosphatidylinositol N-acetylglucosaminyltransferase-domain-containing protein [Podospora appendiculata]
MAPPSGLHQSALPSDFEAPFPPLVRSSTLPTSLPITLPATTLRSFRADPSHLAPEDAFASVSPPRRPSPFEISDKYASGHASGNDSRRPRRARRTKDGARSQSRRRKRFQKLLWVKQSYPDNYTDQATFLENLQRNPRVQPYDFWPLVADSTVIVQHVCSVILFIVCFVGIFQERVNPASVVGVGSVATFLGWLLWDWWVGQESQAGAVDGIARTRSIGGGVGVGVGVAGRRAAPYSEPRPPRRQDSSSLGLPAHNASTTSISSTSNLASAASSSSNLLQDHYPNNRPAMAGYYTNPNPSNPNLLIPGHAHSRSFSSLHSASSQTSATSPAHARQSTDGNGDESRRRAAASPSSSDGGRGSLRIGAIKSASLISFTLLGLSPILKSLTRSTSSDSIWAMSFWLLAINIFFFDYSGSWTGVHKVPVASLSTNAALMASTVLASRLPSTGQVFSLTLFSIEVFGLFPVFRRYARHRSWRYHVVLTVLLVAGAGGGVGMVLGTDEPGWPWRNCLLGMVVGCLITALAMGGCSWWLISLQKYKNEIYGPWDPARPIIISRRHWDDDP